MFMPCAEQVEQLEQLAEHSLPGQSRSLARLQPLVLAPVVLLVLYLVRQLLALQ